MTAARSRRALVLAALGGVTFALSAPPTNVYPGIVVGLALLAASIADTPDQPATDTTFAVLRRAFGRACVWGTAAGIVGLRFVPTVIQRFTPLGVAAAYLALILLACAQSLIWAIGAATAAGLHRRAHAPFELSFAAGVFVAISLPTIFAWSPAALATPWPAFVQLGDVVGERGVSALFAVGAALLCRAALALAGLTPRTMDAVAPRPRDLRGAASAAFAAVALFAALALHGTLRMRAVVGASEGLPTVRIGLVDQAVAPEDRWMPKHHARILRTLRDLTMKLEAEGAELTIWPEAAYPYPLDHEARMAPRGAHAIVGNGVRGPVLVGLITLAKPTRVAPGHSETNSYNSATLVSPDGSMQPPYDKLQLLWFGEMVPGGAQLPWLRRLFQKSGGLIPGEAPRALELVRTGGPPLHLGVLNCYEDTLPDVGRRLVTSLTPNLLVNVTNDAWFFRTAEPELHARLAAMRAVELRLDLVRAVNMGVASWVDASGRVRASYDGAEPGTLLVTPTIRDGSSTLYARVGDAPVAVVFAGAAAVFAVRARRRTLALA